jgi:hypothetical protein
MSLLAVQASKADSRVSQSHETQAVQITIYRWPWRARRLYAIFNKTKGHTCCTLAACGNPSIATRRNDGFVGKGNGIATTKRRRVCQHHSSVKKYGVSLTTLSRLNKHTHIEICADWHDNQPHPMIDYEALQR